MMSLTSKTLSHGQQKFHLVGHKFPRFLYWLSEIDLIDGPKAGRTTVDNQQIIYIPFGKAFDPGFSPVLTIKRPFVDHPGVDTISVFGDDFIMWPHRFHNLAMSVDLVCASMFI